MKKIFDWIRPISQTLLLIAVALCAIVFDFKTILVDIVTRVGFADKDIPSWLRLASAFGRIPLSLAVVTAVWLWIRKLNKDSIINPDNGHYHDHCFLAYWFCAKILGYKTCRLKCVPIPMQIQLVAKGIFTGYIYDEDIHTISKEDDRVRIVKGKTFTDTVNILVSDTYKISKSQLPRSVRQFSCIQIDRSSEDRTRYYSENLVNTVTSVLCNLPENVTVINIFMTTNPANTFHIAKESFPAHGRSTIEQLNLYSQSNKGPRNFEDKPVPLFWPGWRWYWERLNSWLTPSRKNSKAKTKNQK